MEVDALTGTANNDAGNSSESPPRRRRRSSFFERRRSIAPEPSMHLDLDETKDENYESELTQYYAMLLAEKDRWKKEVQNRRGVLHDAELQLNLAKKSDKVRINYSILSNEDIEFIRAKPNLAQFVDSVKKLQKSMKETYAFYKRLDELESVILENVQEKIDKVTQYVLTNSVAS